MTFLPNRHFCMEKRSSTLSIWNKFYLKGYKISRVLNFAIIIMAFFLGPPQAPGQVH